MKWIAPLLIVLLSFTQTKESQNKLAVLKYKGGGDWYSNPSSIKNLIKYCNYHLKTDLASEYDYVSAESAALFQYPFIHMTGHGNVVFNSEEMKNIRTYLKGGGFLHIDDNYGMDPYIRSAIALLFPNESLQIIPKSHAIFHQVYDFPNGLPKIHEHDDKAPEAWGIFLEGQLVLLYTYECDLSDGWEDPEIHNDPEDLRQKAFQMGANIVSYAFDGPKK